MSSRISKTKEKKSKKQIYQVVKLDLTNIEKVFRHMFMNKEMWNKLLENQVSWNWYLLIF